MSESNLTSELEEVRAYARRLEAILAEHRAAFLMGYGQHGEKALEELEAKALGGLEPTLEFVWPDDAPESCGNCGADREQFLRWTPTGGWICLKCGAADYPEAAD